MGSGHRGRLRAPLGAVTPLFDRSGDDDATDFDVSADGQRILTTRSTGTGGTVDRHLVLVQNWRSGIPGGIYRR